MVVLLENEDVDLLFCQGDMIIKRAEKTETHSFIPLHPKLKTLLDKYDWNLNSISSQKFNPNIQKICKMAGFT